MSENKGADAVAKILGVTLRFSGAAKDWKL